MGNRHGYVADKVHSPLQTELTLRSPDVTYVLIESQEANGSREKWTCNSKPGYTYPLPDGVHDRSRDS